MNKPVANERGMILLSVLLVVTLLVTLLSEFAFSSRVDLRLAETARDTTRAYYIARGGVQVARALLADDSNGYDSLDETWAEGVVDYPVGAGSISLAIEDLGGRIDLNRLVTPQGNTDPVVLDRLARLFDQLDESGTGDRLDALIDWLDPDGEPQARGAESSYYNSLENPYNSKDGQLGSIDELTLVRGFTDSFVARLRPHVTVFGSPRININTASREVLLSLSEEMSEDAVETILDARSDAPFQNVEQIRDLSGLESLYGFIYLYIDVKSSRYRVAASARVNDGRREITAAIAKNEDRLLFQRVH